MDVGRSAAAATVGTQAAQQPAARTNSQQAADQNQQLLALSKSASGQGKDQNLANSAVAGQGRRDQGQQHTGAREKDEIIAQALSLLSDLAAIDPERVSSAPEERHRSPPEAFENEVGEEDQAFSPSELFGRFARDLQKQVGQLAWGYAQSHDVSDDLIERLRNSPRIVQDAGGWWYRRTVHRGQAEAQLQELKVYVKWLCERGPGLSILTDMANAHGRAVGSILREIDVLCRIIRATVDRLSERHGEVAGEVRLHPAGAFDKRHSQTNRRMKAHAVAGERAEQSARMIEHLNNQLLGANEVQQEEPIWPCRVEGDLLSDLELLLRQIKMFRAVSGGEEGLVEQHVRNFQTILADIRGVIDLLSLSTAARDRWEQLEVIGGLLLVRLQSAGSWVNSATLDSIHKDVTEAIELALSACRDQVHRQPDAIGAIK